MIDIFAPVTRLIELGGPVVALLGLMSVGALAAIIWKFWHFRTMRAGHHVRLNKALTEWEAGRFSPAKSGVESARSYLAPALKTAMEAGDDVDKAALAEVEAETALSKLESGFRLLDSIAQIAPLLGLFGTVLGMIDAFQSLQGAGASVDPSILAGGIWVALLTTAVGLGVAMPTQLVLTWFESRVARERVWAEGALARIRAQETAVPSQANTISDSPLSLTKRHAG